MAAGKVSLESQLIKARALRDKMQEIEDCRKPGSKLSAKFLKLKTKRDELMRNAVGCEALIAFKFRASEASRYARAQAKGRMDQFKKDEENYVRLKARLSGRTEKSIAKEFNKDRYDIALTKAETAQQLKNPNGPYPWTPPRNEPKPSKTASRPSSSFSRSADPDPLDTIANEIARNRGSDRDDAGDRNYAAEQALYNKLHPWDEYPVDEETKARRDEEIDRILYNGRNPKNW